MSAEGTYLYAVVRPLPADALADVTGVGGGRVRALESDGLGCLVSTVPLDEFGEQELAANLNELSWLERVAREHDAVVRAAAQLTTTAPLRMATICRDDDAALAKLAELGPDAAAVLDRLDGRVEWGVKAFAAAVPAQAPAAAAPGSGADYLRRRKQESEQRQRAESAAGEQAEAVYAALAGESVAGRRHRAQDPQLTGVEEPMLLNAAFLVEHGRAQQFANAVDELAGRCPAIRLERTGPWPPYSFASLETT